MNAVNRLVTAAAIVVAMIAAIVPATIGVALACMPESTVIHDRAALNRLINNGGITVQWIGWDDRGRVAVRNDGGLYTIRGSQAERGGPGRVAIDGVIAEIGADYFIFEGLITISDTPDRGRRCAKSGSSRFAITQNRRYWRLREFEWCDGLTDYIDIYY